MTALLVMLGGAVGASARYLTDLWVQGHHRSGFPWGTFTVNAAGSLLLGLVAGSAALPPWALTLVGTGFCGALTTFSTFSLETYVLMTSGRRLAVVGNVAGSLAVGLAAVSLGWWLAPGT
ncbi:MAG TPA: fluoride efflux transporter CrcB [Nocardioides sp.]|uniref:fluoride efflux transporter CrcB n=1 Tax=Nocardioides sp. TaxID=35761 RepID=UPI002ED93C5B